MAGIEGETGSVVAVDLGGRTPEMAYLENELGLDLSQLTSDNVDTLSAFIGGVDRNDIPGLYADLLEDQVNAAAEEAQAAADAKAMRELTAAAARYQYRG